MKKILLIGGLAIVSSLIWAYWYTNQGVITTPEIAIEGNILQSATTTPSKPVTEERKTYKGQSLSYLGSQEYLSSQPKEVVDNYQKRLVSAVELSKQNPDQEVYWIEIGLVKKTMNNYIGARDAWEYALVINPENSVVYNNLGNLYSMYLGDFSKAEKNYNLSLALDPMSAQPYLALADFYKDFYTAKSAFVDDILLEGLSFLPKDANLILNLALYYKSVGNKEGAISYFEKFLVLPDLTGTQQEAVKAEIAALKASATL